MSDLELSPIGNCQVSALVDTDGGFVWGCVPRVDGDPVFCSLLNGDRDDVGTWRFELEGQVSSSQRYVRNSPILVTRLEAEDGSALEIYDFAPRFETSGRMYRPVAFTRIIRPVAGAPRMRVTLAPMMNHGGTARPDHQRDQSHPLSRGRAGLEAQHRRADRLYP